MGQFFLNCGQKRFVCLCYKSGFAFRVWVTKMSGLGKKSAVYPSEPKHFTPQHPTVWHFCSVKIEVSFSHFCFGGKKFCIGGDLSFSFLAQSSCMTPRLLHSRFLLCLNNADLNKDSLSGPQCPSPDSVSRKLIQLSH